MKPSMVAACAVLASTCQAASGQTCAADLNQDRVVDGADLGALLGAWGPCQGCPADLNGDAMVNAEDLGSLLVAWGLCPPAVPAWATLIEPWPSASAVPDNRVRADIRATGLAWRVRHTASQVEMLLVPPGTFDRGCSTGSLVFDCMPIEAPVHTVRLSSAFYIGRCEVTQAQWTAIMGSNPSQFQGPSHPDSGSRPVERVSWLAVQSFLGATGLRLPTEAEWEHACRAGTATAFYNGSGDDSTLGVLAWYWENAGGMTRPVGQKRANGFGLHDMLGNVWEWVADWYGEYGIEFQVDPQGPSSGSFRVIRGGGWGLDVEYVRSSGRFFWEPPLVASSLGFRVARSP